MITNKKLWNELAEMRRQLELMDRTLVVNNPDSPRASEAYDGLRKQLARGASAAQTLEASLAQLDQFSRSTEDIGDVRAKIQELMTLAGVKRTTDTATAPRGSFQVMGEGTQHTVTKAAYVAGDPANIVVQGAVEFFDLPADPEQITAAPTTGSDIDTEDAAETVATEGASE